MLIRARGRNGRWGVVFVRRRHRPLGWAVPGGFVDVGETIEHAAAREALEETGLRVRNLTQFAAYSDPRRDPRGHTVAIAFTCEAPGVPKGGDDAAQAEVFDPARPPRPLVFDHATILRDYRRWLRTGRRPDRTS